jgi:hypothetical protein
MQEMKDRATSLLQTALANPAADFRAGQWECIEGILRSQLLKDGVIAERTIRKTKKLALRNPDEELKLS